MLICWRCLVPVDSFFEWKAIKGVNENAHAIAKKSREPFALAGIWENWLLAGRPTNGSAPSRS